MSFTQDLARRGMAERAAREQEIALKNAAAEQVLRQQDGLAAQQLAENAQLSEIKNLLNNNADPVRLAEVYNPDTVGLAISQLTAAAEAPLGTRQAEFGQINVPESLAGSAIPGAVR